MKELEDKILEKGQVLNHDVLKVDSFLNHQVDSQLMYKIGQNFYEYFKAQPITKILTVESSGIAPAVMTGLFFQVPVVFARKHRSVTMNSDIFVADVYSFTKKVNNKISISKNFLQSSDNVLIVDDFLANGQAIAGLTDIINQAEATLYGIGIVIEKTFQKGRQMVEQQQIPIKSLARIAGFQNGQVIFAEE
ncbi:xanthine phosphoribosyltransferase [Bombilactobacillus thymidiniphilus]|uniref:Xanthine phosphoribosyltransferase n=1 Tax=Bombilactobacillus thymidiniphilus TaxID=2923363 RepID=A0ABY4PCE1_9LACO|nr:xanthine phosphoribosyltransferase [Bombilactobacillus thymidiniphilus]UQS83229.1 xanthine phosphoribosyltransferase [Bombilactobacillus thymidiniphilus]